MFGEINRMFNKAKRNIAENEFIVESVLDVEEVLPGSEDEFDDEIDIDSVPEDVYKEIDKKLDELISRGDYDDEEVEEMVDDDDLDDDDFEIKVEEVIDEAVNKWTTDLNESRQLDKMRKDANDHINKAKRINSDNAERLDRSLKKLQDDYRNKNENVEHPEEPIQESNTNTVEEENTMSANNSVNQLKVMLEAHELMNQGKYAEAFEMITKINEDASYGSGESVEVDNKTNDVVDGDKVKTEEAEFEDTAEAKRDLDKGEELYNEEKQESDANLGSKEGDHAEMETKNPITNEDVTLDEDFDFNLDENFNTVANLRGMMNGDIPLDEGAVIQKWATMFSSDFKNLKKKIKAAEKAKKSDDTKAVKEHKTAVKKLLADVEKKARDIPKEVSKNQVLDALKQMKQRIDNI